MRHFSSTQNISIIGQKIFKMLKIEQNEIERKIKFSVIDSIIKKGFTKIGSHQCWHVSLAKGILQILKEGTFGFQISFPSLKQPWDNNHHYHR